MNEREQLEWLCSRHLDGELSPAEEAQLMQALEQDAALREFFDDLTRAHEGAAALAETRLPGDFNRRVMDRLPGGAPLIRIGWRSFAAAAAVLLAIGLIVGLVMFNGGGGPDDSPEVAIDEPAQGPSARMVAFSEGEMEVATGAGTQRTVSFDGEVALPAEIRAPRDAHAVVRVGNGTAVLSPGSSARLVDMDADGVADFEPVSGDLYMEGTSPMFTRLGKLDVSIDGGMTLRRTADGFLAEPSHGGATIGGRLVPFRRCATIRDGAVSLRECEDVSLDDWAIRGRVDAIKRQVKVLLGARIERVPDELWERSEALLYGVLSRPAMAATNAYMIRLLLRHGFFEDFSDDERAAWTAIADIVAEGTSEDDIPPQVMEMFRHWETQLEESPERIDEIRRMVRHWMERTAENQQD